MSSGFLGYEPCPECRARGKDSRGDNLGMYRDGGGHCWSCGYHVHPPLSNRWEKKVDHDKESKVKRILPDDFTWDVPARCWEWLLQYGLPYDYWKPIVGWSEKYQRMVFRVGDPLSFSIGRLLPQESRDESQHATYGHKRKWHVWGDAHKHVEIFGKSNGTIVLVEDLISAHKVGQVSECIPLFGTQISPALLYYLRQRDNIILWLDKDQGDTMPQKSNNLSILTGLPVNYIISDRDPKEYNANQISHFISSCRG
jgi:hypothetical protein